MNIPAFFRFLNKKIEKCHKEYENLLSLWDSAHRELDTKANFFNRGRLQRKFDKVKLEFEEFSRNVYAKVVFDSYSKIQPKLVRVRTGKKCEWSEVFKPSFEELNNLQKSILVGLVEESGGYRFA